MNYLTMARIVINGKNYIVCDCRLLENVEACTNKAIRDTYDVKILKTDKYVALNSTPEFVSDLNKIIRKYEKGETSKYYRGDYNKYYITDYYKIVDMFYKLEGKVNW